MIFIQNSCKSVEFVSVLWGNLNGYVKHGNGQKHGSPARAVGPQSRDWFAKGGMKLEILFMPSIHAPADAP
jgi:hypothetical protein